MPVQRSARRSVRISKCNTLPSLIFHSEQQPTVGPPMALSSSKCISSNSPATTGLGQSEGAQAGADTDGPVLALTDMICRPEFNGVRSVVDTPVTHGPSVSGGRGYIPLLPAQMKTGLSTRSLYTYRWQAFVLTALHNQNHSLFGKCLSPVTLKVYLAATVSHKSEYTTHIFVNI